MRFLISLVLLLFPSIARGVPTIEEVIAQNRGNPNWVPSPEGIANIVAQEASGTTRKYLLAAAIIALVVKYATDFLLKLTNPRDGVKQALPFILAGLGLIGGVLDAWIGGAKWTDAVIVGGAGLGAVVTNELGNALKALKALLSKPEPVVATVTTTPPPPPTS